MVGLARLVWFAFFSFHDLNDLNWIKTSYRGS